MFTIFFYIDILICLSSITQDLSANPQLRKNNFLELLNDHEFRAYNGWAGRDLNPRFPPCQGGVLTRLDHRPLNYLS